MAKFNWKPNLLEKPNHVDKSDILDTLETTKTTPKRERERATKTHRQLQCQKCNFLNKTFHSTTPKMGKKKKKPVVCNRRNNGDFCPHCGRFPRPEFPFPRERISETERERKKERPSRALAASANLHRRLFLWRSTGLRTKYCAKTKPRPKVQRNSVFRVNLLKHIRFPIPVLE